MKPTTHIDSPAFSHTPPYAGPGTELQEDWSDIWALEDPAISGAVPIGQTSVGEGDAGSFR